MANATCHKEKAEDPPSLFQNGDVVFRAYHVGWIASGALAMVATVASMWLVNKHLQWYTNKREQRYIVRLLFLVPIYAIISFASYLYWNHAAPLLLIRDAYEAIVLTAFFYLLLMYLSPDPDEQKAIFMKAGLSRKADMEARRKGEKVRTWVFPLGFVKWKPEDGLYFLQLMKWGVLQYCVVRPTSTLAAVILDYMGLYCEESWGLGWGHIYITIVISLSVTIAMYCLIQLYVPVAKDLARHKPLLKLFAVKAVVFLTFWQATFLSVLSMFGVVKDTEYMTAADINIGIGALLECFEMMLFAFLHIRAFSYKPYRPFHSPRSKDPPPDRTPRLRALGHAFDFRETFREIWVGCIYLYDKMRCRDPSPDFGVKRTAHYEEAFGRPRPTKPVTKQQSIANFDSNAGRSWKRDKGRLVPDALEVEVEKQVDIDVEGEKQWLGLGDNYGYGLGYIRREKSEGLEEQIERELERRGYGSHVPGGGHIISSSNADAGPGHKRPTSWWRSIYNRISQTGHEPEEQLMISSSRSKHRSRRASHPREVAPDSHLLGDNYDFDDPPPPSVILAHQLQFMGRGVHEHGHHDGDLDVLAPLSVFKGHRSPPHRGQRGTSQRPPGNLVSVASPPLHQYRAHSVPDPVRIPRINRSDSLLERVFPDNTDNESSVEMASNSARSLPSVSHDGVTPSQATPRARLLFGTPQILPHESHIELLGARQCRSPQALVHMTNEAQEHQASSNTPNSPSISPPQRQPSELTLPQSRYSFRRESISPRLPETPGSPSNSRGLRHSSARHNSSSNKSTPRPLNASPAFGLEVDSPQPPPQVHDLTSHNRGSPSRRHRHSNTHYTNHQHPIAYAGSTSPIHQSGVFPRTSFNEVNARSHAIQAVSISSTDDFSRFPILRPPDFSPPRSPSIPVATVDGRLQTHRPLNGPYSDRSTLTQEQPPPG